MKNIFFFLLLINLQIYFSFNIYCQNQKISCGSWCENNVYPYKMCGPNNEIIDLCTSDPNNNLYGYKPLKVKIPPDFFVEDYPDPYGCGIIYENGQVLFDPFDAGFAPDQAAGRWSRLCPAQGPDDEYPWCVIKVRWERDARKFPKNIKPKSDFAYYKWQLKPQAMEPCALDCDKCEIVLNCTDDFIIPSYTNPCDYKGHFFTTRTTDKSGWNSLHAVLLHEFGHYFGFSEQYMGNGAACGDRFNSIMGNSDFDSHLKTLSSDDECMFKKLYCCVETMSDIHDKGLENEFFNFEIYPNPAIASLVKIKSQDFQTFKIYLIQIYDIHGNIVLKKKFVNNLDEVNLDISGLNNGEYVVILFSSIGQKLFQKNFIISR